MTGPPNWSAPSAVASLRAIPWNGRAWRFHRRRYEATDAAGSLRVSGRYHRGTDQFPPAETWAALYFGLSPAVPLGEVLRHFSPAMLPQLNEYRLSELDLTLTALLDCRDAAVLGLSAADLLRDHEFALTQEIAAAAIAQGAEGLLVPSATGLGDNLVLFPTHLYGASRLVVVESRDPRLYVPP